LNILKNDFYFVSPKQLEWEQFVGNSMSSKTYGVIIKACRNKKHKTYKNRKKHNQGRCKEREKAGRRGKSKKKLKTRLYYMNKDSRNSFINDPK
jgi:hypothetical protein